LSKLALLFLMTIQLTAQCETVRHISGNFAFDIDGEMDTRPTTWGRHGVQTSPLAFQVPTGQRVRILRIVGDLTARWRTLGQPRPEGLYTGVLAAIHKPESSGSRHADWAADGHFVYVQGDIGETGVVRVPFDQSFDPSDPEAVLENPMLVFKFAKYLDETPFSTHAEITFSQIDFCFEAAQ
jgi:hypothetical protein